MKQIVSFDKLKLTNNLLDDNGHVSDPRTSPGNATLPGVGPPESLWPRAGSRARGSGFGGVNKGQERRLGRVGPSGSEAPRAWWPSGLGEGVTSLPALHS